MAENTNLNSENQEELSKKDFHEIMMKQYELLNSKFNTICQLQLDNEGRSSEFDFTRLIPGFLGKKQTDDNGANTVKQKSIFTRLFNSTILLFAHNFKLIAAFTLVGLILGIIVYFTTQEVFTNTIKYNSGVLTNNFFRPIVNKLGDMTDDNRSLAKALGITEEEASKVTNIEFIEFREYQVEKKGIYTLYGLVFGIFIALCLSGFKALQKKAEQLVKESETENKQ